MRRLLLSALFLWAGSLTVPAQDSAPHDMTVKIIDRKGEPIPNVVVYPLSATTDIGVTGKDGTYVLRGITDRDSISVNMPQVGQIIVPAVGLETIQLILKSRREVQASDLDKDEDINIVYGTVKRRANTLPLENINVDELLKQTGATTLSQLLVGQLPGVNVSTGIDGSAYITLSPNQGAALIVVDGTDFASFQEVEDRYNVNQFSTITILKNGASYGVRGGNGVVILMTKRGVSF